MMRNDLHLTPRLTVNLAVLSAASACLLATAPALAANITIGSPVSGTHLGSPVLVRAHNIGCNGFTPTSFGYSIDDSSALSLGETAYDIDVTNDPITAGTHTIHFKSWTSHGECPAASTTFTVVGNPSMGIPPNAISSGDLDARNTWTEIHDGGTPGKSTGTTSYPAKTPVYDDAREFHMTYVARAGERWNTDAAIDAEATHFAIDAYVMLANPSQVLNLEMDVNHVMANGETVILSTQCSGVTKTWEYGFTVGRLDHWWSTPQLKCDPTTWTANVWHHIQIGMHHDANGVVTHDWVILDGVYTAFINATRGSAKFLDWQHGVVNTQFQIEGTNAGTGSVTAYTHKLTVYRW